MLWVVGLATAGLTAFYMWRLMNMTFYGKSRVAPEVAAHIHESPASMTVPLTAAGCRQRAGRLAGRAQAVEPAARASARSSAGWSRCSPSAAVEAAKEGEHAASTEWTLMGLSVAVAIIGIADGALFLPLQAGDPRFPRDSRLKPLYTLLYNKWYVDEIYDFLFVNGLCKGGGLALGAFDRDVVDGGVNGAGWLTRFSSTVSIWWDTWIVDGAVRFSSFFVKMLSYPVCILRDRPRADLRVFRGGGRVGVPGVLRGAVTIWTSTYSASFS